MNKKLISLLVIVLFMSIGFAAVVISLSFAGTAKVAFDEADFNIFFSKVSDGDNLLDTISDDGDSFTFTSDGVSMITYYIINRSVNYNAIINVTCDKDVVVNQESEAILAGTVVSGTVSSSYVGDITCTLNSLPTPRNQQNKNDAILVTLDGQGATLDVDKFYVVKDFPVGALPLPKFEGKTLFGWFTSTEEDATKVTSETIVDFTEDLTLYAQWVDNTDCVGPNECEYVIPRDGKYLLQAWGAQGGSFPDISGGKGGYSYGTFEATADTTLYLTAGGQGARSGVGGFNGGGTGNETYCGGGGASHIALEPGLLKDIAANKVLIVAGGGGGAGTSEVLFTTVTESATYKITNTYGANYSSAHYSCPNGGSLNGSICTKVNTSTYAATYHPESYTCSTGTLNGTQCESTVAHSCTFGNGTGYFSCALRSGMQCECYNAETSSYYTVGGYCPDGYSKVNNKCVKSTDATKVDAYYSCSAGDSLNGTTCTHTETTTYSASYSSGYYYCSGSESLSGSTCTSSKTGTITSSSRLGTKVHTFTASANGSFTFESTSHTRNPYCTVYIKDINGVTLNIYTDDDSNGDENYKCTGSYSSGNIIEFYSGLSDPTDVTVIASADGGFGGGTSGGAAAGSSPGLQTSGSGYGFGGNSTTGAGGGGGYYGGTGNNGVGGGAGGSGYLSSLLTSSHTYGGDSIFLSPTGTNETGHTGNGYIRITAVPYSN